MWSTFEDPLAALARYLTNRGTYPWRAALQTPLGPQTVTLADRHDLLTINEIFCRRDYGSRTHRRVVDIGANVGFGVLFFLTRNAEAYVWAFEADPANVARLRENLSSFESRCSISECAVTADARATVPFVPAGRYGHLAKPGEAGVNVPAIPIERALREIAVATGVIDLVKIDTEGSEEALVAAIPGDLPIREIRYEDNRGHVVTIASWPPVAMKTTW
jgi:FkbM family methyltransferase